jgi:hypothetical protein
MLMNRKIAAILATALLGLPLAAQAQDVPGYDVQPMAAVERIQGHVLHFDGPFDLAVRDERGYVDNVQLHPGTIINPTGIRLQPGMVVSIIGENAGAFFAADEVDTPYTIYAGEPYYDGHEWDYFGAGVALAVFFGDLGWWHGHYFNEYGWGWHGGCRYYPVPYPHRWDWRHDGGHYGGHMQHGGYHSGYIQHGGYDSGFHRGGGLYHANPAYSHVRAYGSPRYLEHSSGYAGYSGAHSFYGRSINTYPSTMSGHFAGHYVGHYGGFNRASYAGYNRPSFRGSPVFVSPRYTRNVSPMYTRSVSGYHQGNFAHSSGTPHVGGRHFEAHSR